MIHLCHIDPAGSALFIDDNVRGVHYIRPPWHSWDTFDEREARRGILNDGDWTVDNKVFRTRESLIDYLKEHAEKNAKPLEPEESRAALASLLQRGQQDIRDRLTAIEERLASLEARLELQFPSEDD